MSIPGELPELRLRPRAAEEVTLSIPADTLAEIREVAASRDMTVDALLKLYIGMGLRENTSRLFARQTLDP